MSSYGSMSPSDEGFDRYDPPFYCQPTHQGSPMDGGVYWPAASGEGHEFDSQDVYHDTTHYITRAYGYEDMQMSSNEPYDAYAHPIHHNYAQNNTSLDCDMQSLPLRYERPAPPSFFRVAKRRTTANKKERRRTQSINTAFSDLRECIPNVPPDTKLSKIARKRSQSINSAFAQLKERIPNVLPDTKLSKIKTLRLATSYISYLLKVLETDGEPAGGFRAELHHTPPRRRQNDERHRCVGACDDSEQTAAPHPAPRVLRALEDALLRSVLQKQSTCASANIHEALLATNSASEKRSKGRTGWPQHVWALELKSEQNLQT